MIPSDHAGNRPGTVPGTEQAQGMVASVTIIGMSVYSSIQHSRLQEVVLLIPFHKEETEAERGSAAFWVSVKAHPLFEICPLSPHVALAVTAQRPPDFGSWSQRAPFSRELRLCT